MDLYIFCSYRFNDPVTRAVKKLAEALEAAPFFIRLHTVNAEHGGSIRHTVFKDLEGSRMVVVIGTRTWGEKTSTDGCTFDEWDFIEDRNKPRYLINMLAPGEEFKVSTTVPIFRNRLIEKWAPNASTGEWDAPPSAPGGGHHQAVRQVQAPLDPGAVHTRDKLVGCEGGRDL